MNRRGFIKITAVAAGLFSMAALPIKSLAAKAWNKSAFESESFDSAINDVFATKEHTPSDQVFFKTPEIAENGAAVPLTVKTSLDDVDRIALFSTVNQRPLISYFNLTPSVLAEVSTRVKLGKTGDVIAVVRSKGKLYSATNEVKVTIGGCGG